VQLTQFPATLVQPVDVVTQAAGTPQLPQVLLFPPGAQTASNWPLFTVFVPLSSHVVDFGSQPADCVVFCWQAPPNTPASCASEAGSAFDPPTNAKQKKPVPISAVPNTCRAMISLLENAMISLLENEQRESTSTSATLPTEPVFARNVRPETQIID
jgi:hypothetical protein